MAHDNLAAALAAFQAELPSIGKDKAVIVEKKGGGVFGYKYATLGSVTNIVVPLLGKHGLSFTSKPTIGPNGFVLAYTLRHASGESDSGEYPLPDPVRTTPQMIGSAITYARRYALCAATAVAPDDEEDDDGQAAADTRADYRPEVREDGSATEAEQARMNRGPVPGTERLKTTPPDDPWLDAPRTDETPREELPGTASPGQLGHMHGLFGKLGIKDRDKRLQLTREIIGRDVQSASALSFVDAKKLNAALEERVKETADV